MVLAVIAVLAVLGFGVIVLSESDSGLTIRCLLDNLGPGYRSP